MRQERNLPTSGRYTTFLTLLSSLLDQDPAARFGPDRALNHTFFDLLSYNDANLLQKTGSAKSKGFQMEAD